MRRKDKEITNYGEIKSILEKADICRIALCDEGNPYIIPMNFGFNDNGIFLHSACEGKKINIIRANNHVCFEAEINTELVAKEVPCSFTMKYCSVIGYGRAYIMEKREDKIKGLNCIMKKYSCGNDFKFDEKILDKVLIIKIEIENITGKKSI